MGCEFLQEWYAKQADGVWEHGQGIRISTIDNPGWSVKIRVDGTALRGRALDPIRENYEHESDWVTCEVRDGYFVAYGGPEKLSRILELFRLWASEELKGAAGSERNDGLKS